MTISKKYALTITILQKDYKHITGKSINAMIARRIVPSSLKISHVRNRVESIQSRRSTTATVSDSYQGKPPASGWKDTILSSSHPMTPVAYFLPFDEEEESKQNMKQEEESKQNIKQETILNRDKMDDRNVLADVNLEELQKLASMRCTPVSLENMYKCAVDFDDHEQRLRNAQFLHRELPIRIAQRAVDLLTLPHGLSEALPIKQITTIYLRYLEKFQELPFPTTMEEEAAFTQLLQSIALNRKSILMDIAWGLSTWRKSHSSDELIAEHLQEMDDVLYRFFTARVGVRFLTDHHILTCPDHEGAGQLRKLQSSFAQDSDFLGCIQADCDPIREVEKVVKMVTSQTHDQLGVCPEIDIVNASRGEHSKFTYVPHHLDYMVSELLKNSCRATVKKYLESEANGKKLQMPRIRVVVVKGKEDVTIKIADRGGGIPRSKIANIWKFSQAMVGEDEIESDFGIDEVCGSKLQGFGLPLARIYARYFGGELTLKSTEGYGLDAYLYLPRLGDSFEKLPTQLRLPVRFSSGGLNSNLPRKAVGVL